MASDHDLLVRIDERVQKLDKCMTNHLDHHWTVTLAVATAALTGISALVIAILGH